MPRLHSSRDIIRVLLRHGFVLVSQRGSHVKYFRNKGKESFTVIIPANRREIPQGTFHSIIRQSGLKKKDFEDN